MSNMLNDGSAMEKIRQARGVHAVRSDQDSGFP